MCVEQLTSNIDVVAFSTLFRVHLTLIIVCLCPKKVLNRSFSGFLCLDGKYAEIGTFGRIFGKNGMQRNSAVEESSNGTSQDEVSSHLARKALTTASHLTTRRRPNF